MKIKIKIVKNKDYIHGGLGDNLKGSTHDKCKEIAKQHGVSEQEILKELELGYKAEIEHTDKPSIAYEIAFDHLIEDPNYYSKLDAAGLEETIKKVDGEWAVYPKKRRKASWNT